MRLNTTFVDRDNSNVTVYAKANEAFQHHEHHKPIQSFATVYEKRKLQLIQKILAMPSDNPLRETTFRANTAYPLEYDRRRVGRPKNRRANEGLKEYWRKVRHTLPAAMQRHEFNVEIPIHHDIIINAARLKIYDPN